VRGNKAGKRKHPQAYFQYGEDVLRAQISEPARLRRCSRGPSRVALQGHSQSSLICFAAQQIAAGHSKSALICFAAQQIAGEKCGLSLGDVSWQTECVVYLFCLKGDTGKEKGLHTYAQATGLFHCVATIYTSPNFFI
jgi:hypothetical protein